MRIHPLLIALSLAANLALAALVWRGSPSAATPRFPSPPGVASSPAAPEKTAATHAVSARPAANRAPLWVAPADGNLDGLIARLRAAGCTPREIRAIVTMWLNKRQFDQLQVLRGAEPEPERPYWHTGYQRKIPNNEAQRFEVDLEYTRLTGRYLLAPELFAVDPQDLAFIRSIFGDLPVEKLRQLFLLQNEFAEQSYLRLAEQGRNTPGQPRYGTPEGPWDELRKQQLAKTKALLTPEEYAEYDLHVGKLASDLRSRLETFRPSQAEFDAIHALEKSFNEGMAGQDLTAAQKAALRQEQDAAIAALLGPERAADYAQLSGTDGKLPKLMVRLDLPLATIGTLNAVRDETNAAAASVRANPALADAQRAAQLAVLAERAAAKLTATLGQRGYETYADMKGDWLRALQPKPVPDAR